VVIGHTKEASSDRYAFGLARIGYTRLQNKKYAERLRLFFAGVRAKRALHKNITICWNVHKTHRPFAEGSEPPDLTIRCVCYIG